MRIKHIYWETKERIESQIFSESERKRPSSSSLLGTNSGAVGSKFFKKPMATIPIEMNVTTQTLAAHWGSNVGVEVSESNGITLSARLGLIDGSDLDGLDLDGSGLHVSLGNGVEVNESNGITLSV